MCRGNLRLVADRSFEGRPYHFSLGLISTLLREWQLLRIHLEEGSTPGCDVPTKAGGRYTNL